jgi:hypothetical protein
MNINCTVCGRGPHDGVSTYRNGKRGSKGVPWRCWRHLEECYKQEELRRFNVYMRGYRFDTCYDEGLEDGEA